MNSAEDLFASCDVKFCFNLNPSSIVGSIVAGAVGVGAGAPTGNENVHEKKPSKGCLIHHSLLPS